MTLELTTAAVIVAPLFFFFWLRWRLRVREHLRAWQVHPTGALELKVCPRCGSTALEGEVECIACQHAPPDDTTWREDSRRFYPTIFVAGAMEDPDG